MQLFGGSELEHFEVFRNLESGAPIAVATTSAEFNANSKDLSARFLDVHLTSSFPMKIYTIAIASTNLRSVTLPSLISVEFRHTYPTSFGDHGMTDLSPSSYAALATRI